MKKEKEEKSKKSEYADEEYRFKKEFEEDLEAHDNYITDFDAYESMLIGQVYDSVSRSVNRASITDSYAATLAIERASRVMGKMPDGEVQASAKKDAGKAAFMNLIRQKWIQPNANSQHPFFTKLRMWQLYSSVYGYMPMFYDWTVNEDGYIGPDCWLWNPRNLVPQQGKVSIADMDYVTALSWVSKRQLKDYLDEDDDAGWNKDRLRDLIELAENGESGSPDQKRDTEISRIRTLGDSKKGICLATRYESGKDGRWITFAPDHGCMIIRNIKNPHKNGRIPFVLKYGTALFDSFYGMGDFQRAKPLQFARDGLTNFYFHGIKMNLSPPIIVNSNGVIKHTIDATNPAQVMMETIPQSIRRLETSTAGLNTYQAAQTQLTGSLLSLYGTQNASIPGAEALNPEQGKTPAAIRMYNEKEATRDGQERSSLEQSIEQLFDGFFSLIANIGTEDIPIELFSEDIEQIIESGRDDLLSFVRPNESGESGTMIIEPKALRGAEYRFHISPGSTAEINESAQLMALERLMSTIGKFQNELKENGDVMIDWETMLRDYQSLSGLEHAKSYVRKLSDEEKEAKRQEELEMMRAQAEIEQMSQTPPEVMQPQQPQQQGGFNDPDLGAIAEQIQQM